jgi:hypothetical protein
MISRYFKSNVKPGVMGSKTTRRGGGGSTTTTDEAEYPPRAISPTPASPPAAPAAEQPAATPSPSAIYNAQAELPLGELALSSPERLATLQQLYSDLHTTENALKWIQQYLPKMYATISELQQNKQRLMQQLAEVSNSK